MASKVESALGDYLKQIKGFELLTPAEERELGAKIRAAAACEERLGSGAISLTDYEQSQQDAAIARDRMIQANLRLVISVAKNFRNRGLPMEDLVNEGNVGLVNAVDRFDPEIGSRFSTYAIYWIDQAIRRAVQSSAQMIHIPSYLIEQIGHMRLVMNELEARLNRQPSITEISAEMQISPRKAVGILRAIRACGSSPAGNGNGASMAETLPDTRTPSPHEGSLTESDADFVLKMLSRITEREAKVLQMRYGLTPHDSGRRMTLKEIGAAVGLTRERVRQIEREAKRKLEEYVKEYI